ncbi:tail lysozyme [Bacillus phage Mater]|uniref:Tail lysozyme n=1 Tax=Bacillus phage Mater TaxID=1540090 RepID=A0A0A0RNU8_9CAUD|nr:baseplate protein [Bacillus phage Mater]AIW03314.1 tail lysozyme [Bacillus phage Mater]
MAKFTQHIVKEGDTLQGIAQQELGDMTAWTAIAQFNNLRYPYIVDTVEEKMENPEHLVTIGDTLLVKITDDIQSNLIEQLKRSTEYDQEELYALALGKDLDILPKARSMLNPSRDSDIFEVKGDSKGRLKTIRGIENLKQSLYIRLITPKGSYVGHPNYGSNLHKYLGMKNTEENAALIDLEIERTLRTDSRVTHVEMMERTISGNGYAVAFSISTITLDQAFEFVLAARQNGPIVLENNFNDAIV